MQKLFLEKKIKEGKITFRKPEKRKMEIEKNLKSEKSEVLAKKTANSKLLSFEYEDE